VLAGIRQSALVTTTSFGTIIELVGAFHSAGEQLVHLQTSKPRVDEVRAWREPEPSQVNRKPRQARFISKQSIR